MSEPEPSRPGSILRAEREALGVTVREVSETLNLSIAVIEAIEADDLERLPGPVFARGYLRSYARLLELDPEPLLAQYPPPPEPSLPLGRVPEPPIREWIRRRPELVLGAAAGVAVLLLVLLVVWLWPSGSAETRGAAAGATEPGFTDDGGAAAVDDVIGGLTAGPVTDVASWQMPASGAAAEDGTSARGGAAVASAAPFGAGGDNVRRITDVGGDRLAFTFSEDCWVEVHSGTGARLYSDLGRGGDELVLVGQGPFRILLGYAPAVQLAFNGEPMPLAPHTRNNVATLVLGQ